MVQIPAEQEALTEFEELEELEELPGSGKVGKLGSVGKAGKVGDTVNSGNSANSTEKSSSELTSDWAEATPRLRGKHSKANSTNFFIGTPTNRLLRGGLGQALSDSREC